MAGKLTAAFVKSARHSGRTGRPEKHYDVHGLFLQVMPSGSKQFVQRLVVAGKRSDYGLGGYPIISLAVAILCDGVEGPGAARLARWRDIDLASRRWTIYLAHGAPGRKSRRRRVASVAGELPPRAVEVFEEARELRDGLRLVRSEDFPLARCS